jgi:hypothetical protein
MYPYNLSRMQVNGVSSKKDVGSSIKVVVSGFESTSSKPVSVKCGMGLGFKKILQLTTKVEFLMNNNQFISNHLLDFI